LSERQQQMSSRKNLTEAETPPPGFASLAQHFENPYLFLCVLSALTLIVYYVSLSFGFVWDDVFQISNNPVVRSWANVPRAFTSDLWYHVHRGQLYYRPLFTTWSILNYSLFQLHPWGWHLTAVLLHIATVLAVYLMARKLDLPFWTSAIAAALFALHPIHIECVAWISAASDTMVTLFYLLAFAAFLQARRSAGSQRMVWNIASLALSCLALLTKEMAVTFFMIVALYVWLFPANGTATRVGSRFRQAVLSAFPYLAACAGYLLLRKYLLHSVAGPIAEHHSLAEYILTLPYISAFYLRLLLLPTGLTGFYYTPLLRPDQYPLILVGILISGAYAGLIYVWQKKTGDRMVSFLGLWPLLTLLPALYLSNFAYGNYVRDRYAYLPSVGFILLGAKAIRLLPALTRMSARAVQTAATAVVLLGFVVGCSQQIYWANELALFQRGSDLYPDSEYARVGFARVLQRIGQNERAVELLKLAISKEPRRYAAYYLLAEAYARMGDREDGRRVLAQGLALSPDPGEMDTADLAGLYGRLGDYDHALQLCTAVLRQEPDLLSALYNCGTINFELARYEEAEKLLSRAVRLAPEEPAAIYWLGRVYLQTNRAAEAQSAFRKALALQPDVYEYHYRLAESLEKAGDLKNAREEYREAQRLDPNAEAATQRLRDLERRIQ